MCPEIFSATCNLAEVKTYLFSDCLNAQKSPQKVWVFLWGPQNWGGCKNFLTLVDFNRHRC